MLAPHTGACHKCGGAIAPGDPVRSFNRPALGTWYHPGCVGSKTTPSAPVVLTASVTPATVSSNGHGPNAAPTLAPSASLSTLDSLASALAPRDTDAACPCDWLGMDYAARCTWLLAAVHDVRMALDSWRSATLAELAVTAATAATPDCARDLECYADGLRHGLRLMGAYIEDTTLAPAMIPGELTPWGAYEASSALAAGHVGYGSLWDAGAPDADTAPRLPWAPDMGDPCTCTIVESADGAAESLVTCVTCAARIAGATS